MIHYNEPPHLNRDQFENNLRSSSPEIVCQALIGISLYDPDWKWVQCQCLIFINNDHSEIKGAAITCFGHIARIHGTIDLEIIVPLLESLTDDRNVGGRALDALDDIKSYVIG